MYPSVRQPIYYIIRLLFIAVLAAADPVAGYVNVLNSQLVIALVLLSTTFYLVV